MGWNRGWRLVFSVLTPLPVAFSALAQTPERAPVRCPVVGAIYQPLGGTESAPGDYRLVHAPKSLKGANQSRLALTISSATIGRSFDFGFAFSNGYGRNHLHIDVAPEPEGAPQKGPDDEGPGSTIYYFDGQLKLVDAPTGPQDSAPAYLMMPEMGLRFWYRAEDRKFIPPDGLWKLTRCAAQ